MTGLHDIQRYFAGRVLDKPDLHPPSHYIKTNGLGPEQRLAIYRNNTRLGLTEALREVYPVINKLVGDDFFNHLAQSYIRDYPPLSGCLLTFGGHFAGFIADFRPTAGLPYLADTARLEWLWHEAFHEADAEWLDIAMLATIDATAYNRLGFTLHPSARLLDSDYPLLAIWKLNQEDGPPDDRVNLDLGGCRLLLFRPGLEVQIIALNVPEYLFLTSLAPGTTLTQSVSRIHRRHPEFDLTAGLQFWINAGLIVDFSIV